MSSFFILLSSLQLSGGWGVGGYWFVWLLLVVALDRAATVKA